MRDRTPEVIWDKAGLTAVGITGGGEPPVLQLKIQKGQSYGALNKDEASQFATLIEAWATHQSYTHE